MQPDKITYFAETDARNRRVKFGIKEEDRLRHIYSIGKTGMGKSNLLENMAIQDIQNGNGMAFLDPHGKTADLLLEYIPEHRIQDVIYFAPFDIEYPISFNVMEDVGPDRRHLVVSGLMSAFEKIWVDAWSARMAYILQNTLAALLEYPGATMLGINRMYSDKAYRQKVVDNISDPSTRSFWVDEYAKYTERFAAEATPAIQNKVGQFTSNPLIRNIIGQPHSTFDIRKIMDEKKILIVNLSKGQVGENNANLLGSMLVTKIYLAAMSRADASPAELAKLPNFYLYVDEFQSFANKSFADILSEARKYKLSLNITHQYVEQMPDEVRAAVFGNVGTMISFRVGSHDADLLSKEFAPTFTMEDLVNLSKYQIYLKLMIDNVASQPFSAMTLGPIPMPEHRFKNEVMQSSRAKYTVKREEVEKQIKEWHAAEIKPELKERRSDAPPSRAKEEYVKKDFPRQAPKEQPIEQRREQVVVVPKEVIKETPKEALKEVPKEQVKEVPKESPREIVREIPKQAPREVPREAPKEVRPEQQKFVSQNNNRINQGAEKRPEIVSENKVRPEPISLQNLKHGDRNFNKGPSVENKNALKEALLKAQAQKPVAPPLTQNKTNPNAESQAIKSEQKEPPKATTQENASTQKEVPEDILRKIIKG